MPLSRYLSIALALALTLMLPIHSEACESSGFLQGKLHHCNTENESDCCVSNKRYPKYYCSPPVTSHTKAKMTLNSFAKGGDGGGPSECDNRYHSDQEIVVALSTGWYNKGRRCGKNIRIYANGRSRCFSCCLESVEHS